MPAQPQPTSQPVSDFLAHLALAPRQAHKALTLWPLVRRPGAPGSRAPAYVPLAEALAAGDLVVDEVSEHGSVPHARVTNRGARAVLVLFGEEIQGAKQNRIANASFLVPAGSELVIDVSCVEQGRWDRRAGARFAAGLGVLSHDLRRKMAQKVRAARAAGGGFHADQMQVWDEIDERVAYAAARAPTRAYADYYATRSAEVDEICRAFRPLPRQVGFVATLGGRVVGLEAVGREEVFAQVFVRLLRGYAIDAADQAFLSAREASRRPGPRLEAPEDFVSALATAPAAAGPSLGLGQDVRLEGEGISGCALVEGDVVHLTAFPREEV